MHQLILPFDDDFVAQHMEYLLACSAAQRSWDKWAMKFDDWKETQHTFYQTGRYPQPAAQFIHDEFIVTLPAQLSLDFDRSAVEWASLGVVRLSAILTPIPLTNIAVTLEVR